jgi:hypothetical protein
VAGARDRQKLEAWAWKFSLSTDQDFEAMMASLDACLHAAGYPPRLRPLNASSLVARKVFAEDHVVAASAQLLEQRRLEYEPFSSADIRRKIEVWYRENYGSLLKIDYSPSQAVVELAGNLWRIRLPLVFGTVHFKVERKLADSADVRRAAPIHNVLDSIDDLTQARANRFADEDLRMAGRAFQIAMEGLQVLGGKDLRPLFEQARANYRHSIEALLSEEYAKARYETCHCLEKILKGLMEVRGDPYHSRKGRGHDIFALAERACKGSGVKLTEPLLRQIYCPAAVVYGETPASRKEALTAHAALLLAFRELRRWRNPELEES